MGAVENAKNGFETAKNKFQEIVTFANNKGAAYFNDAKRKVDETIKSATKTITDAQSLLEAEIEDRPIESIKEYADAKKKLEEAKTALETKLNPEEDSTVTTEDITTSIGEVNTAKEEFQSAKQQAGETTESVAQTITDTEALLNAVISDTRIENIAEYAGTKKKLEEKKNNLETTLSPTDGSTVTIEDITTAIGEVNTAKNEFQSAEQKANGILKLIPNDKTKISAFNVNQIHGELNKYGTNPHSPGGSISANTTPPGDICSVAPQAVSDLLLTLIWCCLDHSKNSNNNKALYDKTNSQLNKWIKKGGESEGQKNHKETYSFWQFIYWIMSAFSSKETSRRHDRQEFFQQAGQLQSKINEMMAPQPS